MATPSLKISNIRQANDLILAADAALAPALVTAGVTTITIDGKPVPASEAPLAARISALLAVAPPGAQSAQIADVVASNEQISSQLTEVTNERDSLKVTNGTLTTENAKLKMDLAAAQASVATLTAEKGDQKNQLDAATNQVASTSKKLNEVNARVSQMCLTAGCVNPQDLKDAEGKILPANASADQKLAAANLIPVDAKLTSYEGAVNAALTRIAGVPAAQIPATTPGKVENNPSLAQSGLLAKLNATTDPVEKAKLRKENAAALRAGFVPHNQTR